MRFTSLYAQKGELIHIHIIWTFYVMNVIDTARGCILLLLAIIVHHD